MNRNTVIKAVTQRVFQTQFKNGCEIPFWNADKKRKALSNSLLAQKEKEDNLVAD